MNIFIAVDAPISELLLRIDVSDKDRDELPTRSILFISN